MKIVSVMVKETKNGKPYKALQFEDNRSANMWEDDPRFADAIDGADLPLELEKNGNFWNIVRDDQPSKANNTGSELQKIRETLFRTHEMVLQMYKAQFPEKVMEPDLPAEEIEYPIEEIDPESIPF